MSTGTPLRGPGGVIVATLDQLSTACGQQRLLRLAAAAAVLLFPAVTTAAGGGVHLVVSGALVAVGVVGVLLPDSNAPLAWMLLAVGLWALAVPETLSAWTLLAAADLLVVHVACAAASYGPPPLALPAGLLREWGGRMAVMLAVTALVWLAARFGAALDLPGNAWVLGSALAVVAGWATYLLPRLLARDGTPDRPAS
ncbi:hypothetical protein [Nocardioides mesophilus]|uniref:hypothetical protein n=1 Tax=Nocardioides mesophilus TaxID=433659 RepID=UPI001CB6B731|nr:hypothetical protein [Nocardioides mesophilus]